MRDLKVENSDTSGPILFPPVDYIMRCLGFAWQPAKMDGCDWGFGTCNPWTSRDCVVERQDLILLASMFGIIYPGGGTGGGSEQLNPDVEHH